MTNYDMTMDMLAASTFHPDSVEQARKYLRDLRASHEMLYDELRYAKFAASHGDSQRFSCALALKAAEALR